MALTKFKFVKIRLDRADMTIAQQLTAKQGAVNGNGIELQLVNGSIVEDTTGVAVYLNWKHQSAGNQGSEPFTLVDAATGTYRVTYPTELLSAGLVDADIKIVDGTSITMTTQPILIKVNAAATSSTVQSQNAWNDIQTILTTQQAQGTRMTALETEDRILKIAEKIRGANLIVNGDFSNGVTAWGASNSTLSALSNVLTITGNGSGVNPYASQSLNLLSTRYYYLKFRARVTNSLCSRILTVDSSGSSISVQNNPVINQWYDLNIVYKPAANRTNIQIWHQYADAATANGKVMEVQLVAIFELTSMFGSGYEPTKADVDLAIAMLGGWTDAPLNLSTVINGLTAKTTPVDADMVGLMDSAASNVLKKLSWANIEATLKTYFDTLYALASHTHTIANVTSLQTSLDAKAPLAGPALTGTPTAPTAVVDTNTTQIATTAFVKAQIADDAALKSSEVSATLAAASWVGSSAPYTLALTVNGVTASSNQELLPSTSITRAQLEALQAANIQDAGQSANTINLKAWGTKPTIDIPIRVILRGDK